MPNSIFINTKSQNSDRFSIPYCYTALQNACRCLTGRCAKQSEPLTQTQKTERVQETVLAVNRMGKQETVFLNARFHLNPFRGFCQYPRRIGCGTPFANADHEALKTRSKQVLFETLPADSQNSLNALKPVDRAFILDEALDRIIAEYENSVHLLEGDIFQFLNQPRLLNSLKFDSQEIDEAVTATLQQSLNEPLRQQLNRFSVPIQNALLNSAYCQLKNQKTGSGDTIYC